jgi:hypothetical protein
MLQA